MTSLAVVVGLGAIGCLSAAPEPMATTASPANRAAGPSAHHTCTAVLSADRSYADRPTLRGDWERDARHYLQRVRQRAGVAIDIDTLLDRSWQLHHEHRLRRQGHQTAAPDESTWSALAHHLTEAEQHVGALGELLQGVASITIAGLTIRGAATEVVIDVATEVTDKALDNALGDASGTVATLPGDAQLNLRLSRPGLQALADDLQALSNLEEALGAPTGTYQSPLAPGQQHAYRRLLRSPMASLQARDLDQLDRLHRRTGEVSELRPGSRLHKAWRWRAYRDRAGEWPFAQWSNTYQQNMTRAREAHARSDRLWRQLGWGERELPVNLPSGTTRVLDIGDRRNLRGVEVKRGYVTLSADTVRELRKDAWLVNKRNWSITWHIDGRCSQPLRDTLRAAKIKLTELRADTPVKEL